MDYGQTVIARAFPDGAPVPLMYADLVAIYHAWRLELVDEGQSAEDLERALRMFIDHYMSGDVEPADAYQQIRAACDAFLVRPVFSAAGVLERFEPLRIQ